MTPETGPSIAQVPERADLLHREDLRAEPALRIELPAAADHHVGRLLIIRIRSEREYIVDARPA